MLRMSVSTRYGERRELDGLNWRLTLETGTRAGARSALLTAGRTVMCFFTLVSDALDVDTRCFDFFEVAEGGGTSITAVVVSLLIRLCC